ncbi:MAG: hypothetical protein HY670_06820 [Chloroflexi bacterium]|nr:hypothetical protein [Chloroflexota bacterium]
MARWVTLPFSVERYMIGAAMAYVIRKTIALIIFIVSLTLTSCSLEHAPTPTLSSQPQFQGGEYLPGLPPFAQPTSLAFDKNGVLWITLQDRGVVAYIDNRYFAFDRMNTSIPDNSFAKVLVDRDNVKWFGTNLGYVYTFDNKEWTILPIPAGPYRVTEKGIEGTYGMADILQDHDGRVWFAAGGVWSYKDKKIDSHFTEVFGENKVRSLTINREGNLIAATDKDIYTYDGQGWKNITGQVLKNPRLSISTIFFDTASDRLYVGTSDGLIVQHGEEVRTLTKENSGLASNAVSLVETDEKGNLWIGYRIDIRILTKYDGEKWVDFPSEHVRDIAYQEKADTWFVASQGGLKKFDGQSSWSIFPVLDRDPRLWWRQKSFTELVQEKTISVDIHDALANPLKYKGQKISFIGKIETGWEYADIIDEQGTRLHIWPNFHPALPTIPMSPKPKGRPEYNQKESPYLQISGYLEFQGNYGHMGGWPFQFYITEIYPLPSPVTNSQKP